MRAHLTGPRLFARCAAAGSIDGACQGLVDDLVDAGFELPSIYLLVGDRLRCHAARGYFQVVDGFPAGRGVIGGVVASGRAELIDDISQHPDFIAAIPGLVAEGCFPVRCDGVVVGVVNVESKSHLPVDTVQLVTTAAEQLGRHIGALGGLPKPSLSHRLARMAVELTAASNVTDIEQRTLCAATEIAGMSSATLARRAPGGGWETARLGPLSPALQSWAGAEWDVVASWVSAGTSSHFPGGDLVDDDYQFLRASGIRALSVHPLVVGGRSDGVLLVASTRPVGHATFVVEALEVLAAQAAASLGLAIARDEASLRAEHDPLTGLGNRARFLSTVAKALDRDRREVAVLLLDLDDFKNANDRLGHQAGDALLVNTAWRIGQLLRAEDTVCRLGGDEFVVVLPHTDRSQAADVAERLLSALSQEVVIGGNSLHTGVSVGIALRSGQQESADELLKAADFAMYLAKEDGKGRYAFFDESKRSSARERLALESDLRAALDDEELHLVYQPIVDLRSGRMTAVEALVRWDSPRRGSVPPDEFIPLAEEKGLIARLGEWVLGQVCEQLGSWDADGGDPQLRVAVNVSTRQLERPGLLAALTGCLAGGLASSRLTLEITESALSLDDTSAEQTLRALRELGMEIAVDDFGTGYSSLAMLSSAPVNQLKIDRSFVHQIDHRHAHVPIVDATLAMAEGLGLNVIAEGVETPAQLSYLLAAGCHHAQGLLLAGPMPPGALTDLVRGFRPWERFFTD